LTAGLIDELHLALSPVPLGEGENLFAGINLHQLGYSLVQTVSGENATHVLIGKKINPITTHNQVIGIGMYSILAYSIDAQGLSFLSSTSVPHSSCTVKVLIHLHSLVSSLFVVSLEALLCRAGRPLFCCSFSFPPSF
jgi:hypothetical protein